MQGPIWGKHGKISAEEGRHHSMTSLGVALPVRDCRLSNIT